MPSKLETTLCLLLLVIAVSIGCVHSARSLIVDPTSPPPPLLSDPVATTAPPLAAALPTVAPVSSVTTPATATAPAASAPIATPLLPPTPLPVAAASPAAPSDVATIVADVAPVVGPTTTTTPPADPSLSFFMHDILGGSHPSGRVVAGIAASMGVNSQLPFSRPNTAIFPMNGGIPLLNNGNNINGLNDNNIPYLAGLGGASSTSTVITNSGNNNAVNGGNNLPFVDAGQLPTGATLQQLMFGTITVVDDELTEAEDLGSSVIGKAQGFYLASSVEGTSHTMLITALFPSGDAHQAADDTISFFGVHRTVASESQIAVVGGTGKYENAKGYANIQTLQPTNDHTTDGAETLHQFSVYLSY